MAGGFAQMQKMMRQLQKMQSKVNKLQEELGERTVEASAGGGMVKVVVTGSQEIQSISIQPEVVDPDDVEMLQDLVVAAVNEGLRKAREMINEEMAKITGGINLNLPGLF